ncbi:hypothetical protein GQ457_07G003830 [Hibiscus cannabinus]
MQIVSSGRQGSKGDRVKPLFKYDFVNMFTLVIAIVYNVRRFDLVACLGPIFCLSGVEYRYPNRVSIPKFNTGIWVSVPAREGIGTPGIDTRHQGLSCGMARPRGGGRRGGRAPVHLDEIGMEPVNKETLPPPPLVAFRKKYLGTRYADEKKREFMALVQGGISVTDYEIQFVRLSQYAPELPEGGGSARVYAQREGRNDTDVIAGNFSLQSLSLLSLIDSGSTHSYILSEHARLLGLPCEVLDVGVNVTSSFGDTVVVRKLYRRCHLTIQGYVFPVDMMELPFYGFDVILGMDWLVEHRARVDFETKKVSLKLAGDHKVVVVGENIKFLSNVVLALEAQRLMDDSCQAYLAYVMNPNMGEARPRDIRTVCDFPGVFRKSCMVYRRIGKLSL